MTPPESPPAEVFNIRHKRLHMKETNCWSMLLESANDPHLDVYASIHKCAQCKGTGVIKTSMFDSSTAQCPGCNGFGILLKMLRQDQVPPSSYGF